MSRQKIIRDPVYDYVAIDMSADGWLLDLLDTPEVQRLKYTSQLGLSYLVYPGAVHSRFNHALGVLHLMQQVVQYLKEHLDGIDNESRNALLAAAVLHDVGHGPFSHLLESKLGKDHEEWSWRIIESEDTQVNAILRREGILERVLSLLKPGEVPQSPWHKSLISSQLDVDRMDYLLRDSHFTGVGYGKFDYYRLIHTMVLEPGPQQPDQTAPVQHLAWPEKTKYAIEEYVFARYYRGCPDHS